MFGFESTGRIDKNPLLGSEQLKEAEVSSEATTSDQSRGVGELSQGIDTIASEIIQRGFNQEDLQNFLNIFSGSAEEESNENELSESNSHYVDQFESELSKLQTVLERGDVTVDEAVINKMFPKLREAIDHLPTQYSKKFILTLQKAYILQTIKRPERLMPNPSELVVFKSLECDVSLFKKNRQVLLEKIQNVLKKIDLQEIGDNEVSSLLEFKKNVKLLVLKEQLKMVYESTNRAQFVHLVSDIRKEIIDYAKKEITESLEQIAKSESLRYPNLSMITLNALDKIKKDLLSQLIKKMNKKVEDEWVVISLSLDNPEEIKKLITPFGDDYKKHIEIFIQSSLDKELKVLKDLGSPIQFENIQVYLGKTDDALGDGVCWANTLRILTTEISHAQKGIKMKDEEWQSLIKLTPGDRFNQAMYELDTIEEGLGDVGYQDHSTKKQYGLKNRDLLIRKGKFAPESFKADEMHAILDAAINQQPKFSYENYGVQQVSIQAMNLKEDLTIDEKRDAWGHALYFRYDPKQKIAHFYDSNAGRSVNFFEWDVLTKSEEFKQMDIQEQEELIRGSFLNAFSNYLVGYYPDVNFIRTFKISL
jgi:hypothetical protein